MDNFLNKLRGLKRNLAYEAYDIYRQSFKRDRLAETVNKKEIRVVGLRRTGNHAIVNWIRQQHTGKVFHLNNLLKYQNPYRYLYLHYPKESLRREAWGNFTQKDCLITSYEDYSIADIISPEFERKHDLYLGKSAKRYDLIILRDPFNLMASRIKSDMIPVKDPDCRVTDLWIEYAKEFLNETNHLNQEKICVNYNQWFLDEDYRRGLAIKLGMEFSDRGIDRVKSQGGGSSFDSQDFDGKARQMDVLNRYKKYADNPTYQRLIDDDELLLYAKRIFGGLDSNIEI